MPLQAENQTPLNEPISPLSQTVELDQETVELGDKLFHDNHLSKNNTTSCTSCHSLKTGGVDNLPKSIGIDGQKGDVKRARSWVPAFAGMTWVWGMPWVWRMAWVWQMTLV